VRREERKEGRRKDEATVGNYIVVDEAAHENKDTDNFLVTVDVMVH
jgi:hypothetical protein